MQLSIATLIYVALTVVVVIVALKKLTVDRAAARIRRYAEARGIAIYSLRWDPFASSQWHSKKISFRAVFSQGGRDPKKILVHVDSTSGAIQIEV